MTKPITCPKCLAELTGEELKSMYGTYARQFVTAPTRNGGRKPYPEHAYSDLCFCKVCKSQRKEQHKGRPIYGPKLFRHIVRHERVKRERASDRKAAAIRAKVGQIIEDWS